MQRRTFQPTPRGRAPPAQPAIRARHLALRLVLLAFVVAFLAGYLPLQQREATLRAEAGAQEHGLPRLVVMRVGRGTEKSQLKLAGAMQAVAEAPRPARTDG